MQEEITEHLCKHCGQRMRRVRFEHCWVCFGLAHESRVTPHREFDSPWARCYCTECENTRDEEQ
jgi:hypothetical protein